MSAVNAAIETLERRTLLSATPLYWDPTGAATAAGGSGTWNTTTAEWRSGSPTGTLVAWSNSGDSNGPYRAVFSAGSGTVTVSSAVSVSGMAFASGTYTVASSSNSYNLTLTSPGMDVSSGIAANISSVLAGSVGLTKTSAGTLNISGSNTYTNGTTLNAGVLDISADATLGTAPASTSTNITFTGTASLQAGATSVALGSTRGIAIGTGLTATLDTQGNVFTINGPISNTASSGILSKGGTSGTLILAGSDSFVSGTVISTGGSTNVGAGLLELKNSNALGTNPITVDAHYVQNNAVATLGLAGGITIGSNGNVTYLVGGHQPGYNDDLDNLSGNNTFNGNFVIDNTGGNYAIQSSDPNGTLTLGGSITEAITNANRGLIFQGAGNGVINGIISNGSGSIAPTFSGNAGTTWTLNNTMTDTGATTINSGTVALNTNQPLYGTLYNTSAGGTVTINSGATLFTQNINALTGYGNSNTAVIVNAGGTLADANGTTNHITNLTLAGGSLTGSNPSPNFGGFDVQAGDSIAVTASSTISENGLVMESGANFNVAANTTLTLSGTLIDDNVTPSVQLIKNGAGTMVLSGASTYTGGTSINAGVLTVANTTGSATGSGNVAVSSGAVLNGAGTIGGTVSVSSGGSLSPGVSSTAIINTQSLTLASGSNLNVDLNSSSAGTGYDQVNVTGTVNLSGSYLNLSGTRSNNDGNQLTLINNDGTDAVIGTFNNLPEGSHLSVNGVVYVLSYHAGSGNDVVLTDATPPLAANDNYNVVENVSLTQNASHGVLSNDTSYNGGILNVYSVDGSTSLVNQTITSSHGTLTLNSDGSFTYVPQHDFVGVDSTSFYVATDGIEQSSAAIVQFVVTAGTLHATAYPITATQGQSTATITVAHFTDDSSSEASNYTASITWGDGQTSPGTVISDGTGGWTVSASHTFGAYGTFTVTPTIVTNQGASVSVQSSATVTPSTPAVTGGYTYLATAGADAGAQIIATFTDPAGADSLSAYAAQVSYDGGTTTVAGAISYSASTGLFTVSGDHIYANNGASYPILITVSHAGVTSPTVTSTAVVQSDMELTATAYLPTPSIIAPVTISWLPANAGETSYLLQRSVPGGAWITLGATAVDSQYLAGYEPYHFVDSTASSGVTYAYRALAITGSVSAPTIVATSNTYDATTIAAGAVAATTPLQSIQIPLNGDTRTSTFSLAAGVQYKVTASSYIDISYNYSQLYTDAEWTEWDSVFESGTTNVHNGQDLSGGPSGARVNYGIGIDNTDLSGNKYPFWGPYDPSHIYSVVVTGTGQPVTFNFHDDDYPDNQDVDGVTPLNVQIFQLTQPSVVHHPPVFNSTPVLDTYVGTPYVYPASAYDVDDDPMTFSIGPAGAAMNNAQTLNQLAIDANSALVTWTPTQAESGHSYQVDLRVSAIGGFDEQVYTVVVHAAKDVAPPVITNIISQPPNLIPYHAQGWKYQQLTDQQYNSTSFPTNWAATNFDDSQFQIGRAGFGSQEYDQGGLVPPPGEDVALDGVGTYWAIPSDPSYILLRHTFNLSSVSSNLVAYFAIDNDLQVYINGNNLTSSVLDQNNSPADLNGDYVHNGRAQLDGFHLNIPASVLHVGTNVIAIKARNNEAIAFIDARVTAVPLVSYQVVAQDSSGLPLTYSLAQPYPGGMAIDPATGLLTWSPTSSQTGNFPVTISVTDGVGGSASQTFTISIDPLPAPGEIQGSVLFQNSSGALSPLSGAKVYVDSGDYGLDSDFAQTAVTDGNGNYTLGTLFGSTDYTVRVIAPSGDVLVAPSVLFQTASVDSDGDTVTLDPFICSSAPTTPTNPEFLNSPGTLAPVGSQFNFLPEVTNPSGTQEAFALTSAPAGMVVDPTTGRILWTPATYQLGLQSAVLQVTDALGGSSTLAFTLTAFGPPQFTSVPQGPIFVGVPWSYAVRALDPLNGPVTLTFPTASNPSWLSFDAATGIISGTPTASGDFNISVVATTTLGASAIQTATLTVMALNPQIPPTFTSTPKTSIQVNGTYVYHVVAVAGGSPITYGINATPNLGITLGADNTIRWTPTAVTLTPIHIIISATANGWVTDQIYDLSVTAVHAGPNIISTPPLTAVVGAVYHYALQTDNRDPSPLTWSLLNNPVGMVIDATSGLISWTPATRDIGSQPIKVQVIDADGDSTTQSYSITVASTYGLPQITSTPPLQVTVGSTYTYQVVATDPNGLPLTYALGTTATNAGLQISSAGLVSWTPTAIPSVNPVSVVITVADAHGSVSKQYNLQVVGVAGGQPKINSSPNTIAAVGRAYTYQVTATDIGGTLLAAPYSIPTGGAPAGMTINSTTGLLTWANPTLPLGGSGQPVSVTVVATDTSGAFDAQTYLLYVVSNYVTPTIDSIPPATVVVGFPYEQDAVVHGGVGPFSFTLSSSLSIPGLAIDSAGHITWSPTAATGLATVTVTAVDALGTQISTQYGLQADASVPAPSAVSVTPDRSPAFLNQSTTFTCAATSLVGIASYTLVATPINGTSGSVFNISVNAQGIGIYNFTTSGDYQLVVTATDKVGQSTASSTITLPVIARPDSPVVHITSPVATGDNPEAKVPVPTLLTGTLSDNSGLVSYVVTVLNIDTSSIADTKTFTFTPTGGAYPHSANIEDHPYTFDTTRLANGNYEIDVTATNTYGLTSTDSTQVIVNTSYKRGALQLSYTDLQTNVGDQSVTITRAYDSLESANNSDFGYGWTLTTNKGKLTTDVQSGQQLGTGYYPYLDGTRVTITLPDGTTRGFTTVLVPDGTTSLTGLYLVEFLPDDDSRDTRLELVEPGGSPVPTQRPFDNTNSGLPDHLGLPDALANPPAGTLQVSVNSETGELMTSDGLPFNPANLGYNLMATQLDGSKYEYDAVTDELLYSKDQDGTSVTYNDHGDQIQAVDRTGKILSRIQINRDGVGGRINSIQSFAGSNLYTPAQQVNYFYDSNGDLNSFENADGQYTDFTYNRLYSYASGTWTDHGAGSLGLPHFLTRITDRGTGVATATAVFDSNGFLDQLLDASGNAANISYQIDDPSVTLPSGDMATVMVDALGNKSASVHDGNGNLLRQIQQIGTDSYLVTVYTYDGNQNQTSASKPHQVSGADRYTWEPTASDIATSTVYGDGNNKTLPTEVTDANGQHTFYAYDSHGNTLTITDPLNRVTTNTYNPSSGQLQSSVDANNVTTHYAYSSVTGTLNGITQTDANGNTLPVVTSIFNDYDTLTGFTNAAGAVFGVEYDLRGEQTATSYLSITGQVIRDEVDYNGLGRITATRHRVDGNIISSTAFTYDSAGHTITSTDPFGKVTVSRYDAQGNLVEMRTPSVDQNGNPVTLIVRKAYDADGRLIAQTAPYIEGVTLASDILTTHTLYDGAGREIQTRQLRGVGISLTYISGGIGGDHEGGIFQSQFIYDAGTDTYGSLSAASVTLSSNSTTYNDQGQVDHTTSETGLVTYFQYNADGQETESYYDIVLGGVSRRVTTQYQYDNAGRQTAMIDPAGRVTAYVYNNDDQVIKTISYGVEPAGFVPDLNNIPSTAIVTQSVYNSLGQQTATIDGLGRETDYQYDSAGRLVSVTQPSINATDSRRPRTEYHYDSQGHRTYVVTNIYYREQCLFNVKYGYAA